MRAQSVQWAFATLGAHAHRREALVLIGTEGAV